MAYNRTNWQDLPNQTTPINATNLNKIEQGIYDATYVNGVNVGSSVDSDYKVNIIKTNNLIPPYVELSATYTYSGTGEWISSTNYITMKFISVKPNTTYTFKSNASTTKYAQARIYNFNSSKTWISRSDAYTITDGTFTFTTGNTTEYIAIGLYTSSTASLGDITQYQLNEGNTALSYEPYKRNIVVDNEEIYNQDNQCNVGISIDNASRVNFIKGKNLMQIKTIASTTISGITYSISNDGTITLNGTANARMEFSYLLEPLKSFANEYYCLSYIYISGALTDGSVSVNNQDGNHNWNGFNIELTTSNYSSNKGDLKSMQTDLNMNGVT